MATTAQDPLKLQHQIGIDSLQPQLREFLRVKNPLNHLTEQQRTLLEQVKQEVSNWELGEKERQYVDDMCCYRFLLGWKWVVKDALKHLKETCEFRAKNRPDQITVRHIAESYKQGWLFEHGYDKEGHPIVYILLGRDKQPWDQKHNELRFKNICYVMEQCAKRMPEGIYNTTFVVDLKGANINLSLIKKFKNLFIRLGDVYCECLHRCIVMNVGITFTTVWNFIKVFLAKSTVQKYVFVKRKSEAKTLAKYVDPAMVPEDETFARGYGKCKFNFDEDIADRMRVAAMLHFQATQSGEQGPPEGLSDEFAGAEEGDDPNDDELLKKAEEEALAQAESEEEEGEEETS